MTDRSRQRKRVRSAHALLRRSPAISFSLDRLRGAAAGQRVSRSRSGSVVPTSVIFRNVHQFRGHFLLGASESVLIRITGAITYGLLSR